MLGTVSPGAPPRQQGGLLLGRSRPRFSVVRASRAQGDGANSSSQPTGQEDQAIISGALLHPVCLMLGAETHPNITVSHLSHIHWTGRPV